MWKRQAKDHVMPRAAPQELGDGLNHSMEVRVAGRTVITGPSTLFTLSSTPS